MTRLSGLIAATFTPMTAEGEIDCGPIAAIVERLVGEGVEGLYKGLAPSLLKAAPATAITFLVYEALVRSLLPPPGSNDAP